jgi:hypothetical protein
MFSPRRGSPLSTAAITLMCAVVIDPNSMEPLERVGIGVADPVRTFPDQEVVSLNKDVAGPSHHAVIRRVVPGAGGTPRIEKAGGW